MGRALALATLERGHEVVMISGPVQLDYPPEVELIPVVSTEEMLEACQAAFPYCDGLIGAAAPCDYRPMRVEPHKISKTGQPLALHLIETPDIVATLGSVKRPDQWLVGFVLESEDQRFRALTKLQKKSCNLMAVNGPQAMEALDNQIEVIDRAGNVIAALSGSKDDVARGLLSIIQDRLINEVIGC